MSEEEADEEDHYHSARDSEENEEPEEDADDEDAENDHDQESLDRPDNVCSHPSAKQLCLHSLAAGHMYMSYSKPSYTFCCKYIATASCADN